MARNSRPTCIDFCLHFTHQLLFQISLLLGILLAPDIALTQTLQKLHNHVRPAVAQGEAKPVGQMPATQHLNLSIVLPLRNQEQLQSLLARIYDPTSADYRHYLSVQEFTEQFGPTKQDYDAVAKYAEAMGMTVTGSSANRLVVPVSGTVAQVEKAFRVSMKTYQHPTEKRTFFSPDREPSMALGVNIAHIAGLNNFSIPQSMSTKGSLLQSTPTVQGSGPGGSYLGIDMRAAYYGGTALTGSGQVVGLLQFDGYDINDLNLTLTNTGQASSVPINNVLLDGATGQKCQFSGAMCQDAEQVLDIVQSVEMAPGLAQVRVYIGNLDTDILNAMVEENQAKQLSVSWTWTPDDPTTDDIFFQEMAAQGQSIFVASGDAGTFSPSISDFFYPAEDEYVTTVGGTDLVTTGALGSWVSETAWNHSGGGISPDSIPMPTWQAGVANSSNLGSTLFRNVPDVAMEANTDNYACNMGSCQGGWGGTSFAAPRWAGFAALVNQQAEESGAPAVGFLNPALYAIGAGSAYAGTFHDVTSGQNDNGNVYPASIQVYQSVTGYDLVTGWGSPTGQNLIDVLAPKLPTGFQLSSSMPLLSIAPGNSESATINIHPNSGFNGAVNLSITGLPEGVAATWTQGSATTSSRLTLSVASSTLRGSYLLTVTGTSNSVSASTTLSLLVDAPGFTIIPSQSIFAIRPGLSVGSQISVTRFDGFAGPVNLAITSALPTGVTAVWSGNPAQDEALLTLSVDSSAAITSTILTITGTSENLTATATVVVQVGRPGFWLNISPLPGEPTIAPGGTFTTVLTMVTIGNFNEPATLTASGLPAGVTATFVPGIVAPGQSSVMTLSAGSAAVAGSYLVLVDALAAQGRGDFSFPFQVVANPVPAVTFTCAPVQVSLAQGQSSTITVSVAGINGISGSVQMYGIPQLPSGITFAYSQEVVPIGGTTLLTLTAGPNAMPGSYEVGIGGQAGNQGSGATVFITVTPVTSLSMSLSPASLQLPQGQSATATATVTSTSGPIQGTSFAVVSELPQGLSVTFGDGQSAGTGAVTLTASNSLSAGLYTLNIAATSGTETVDVPLTVTITQAQPTFSIAAAAASANKGRSATSTITLNSNSGYAGTIALSCSITSSPAGAIDLPTCAAGPSTTLGTSTSSATTSVTVYTTAATTASLALPAHDPPLLRWADAGGGLIFAGLICIFAPKTRRKWRAMLGIFVLSLVVGGFSLCGCGAGSGSPSATPSPTPTPTPVSNAGTTTGAYTVTVSAKGNDPLNSTGSATFTLTVN